MAAFARAKGVGAVKGEGQPNLLSALPQDLHIAFGLRALALAMRARSPLQSVSLADAVQLADLWQKVCPRDLDAAAATIGFIVSVRADPYRAGSELLAFLEMSKGGQAAIDVARAGVSLAGDAVAADRDVRPETTAQPETATAPVYDWQIRADTGHD